MKGPRERVNTLGPAVLFRPSRLVSCTSFLLPSTGSDKPMETVGLRAADAAAASCVLRDCIVSTGGCSMQRRVMKLLR